MSNLKYNISTGNLVYNTLTGNLSCICCCPSTCATTYIVLGAVARGLEGGVCVTPPPLPVIPSTHVLYDPNPFIKDCLWLSDPSQFGISLVWNRAGFPGYWTIFWTAWDGFGTGSASWIKTTPGGDAAGTYVPTADAVGACTLPGSLTVICDAGDFSSDFNADFHT